MAKQPTCNPSMHVCWPDNVAPRDSCGQDWGSGPCLFLLLSGNTFYNSTIKRCLTFCAGPGDIVWREGGTTTVLELLGHWLHGLRWQSRNKACEGDGVTGMAVTLCSPVVKELCCLWAICKAAWVPRMGLFTGQGKLYHKQLGLISPVCWHRQTPSPCCVARCKCDNLSAHHVHIALTLMNSSCRLHSVPHSSLLLVHSSHLMDCTCGRTSVLAQAEARTMACARLNGRKGSRGASWHMQGGMAGRDHVAPDGTCKVEWQEGITWRLMAHARSHGSNKAARRQKLWANTCCSYGLQLLKWRG